MRLPLHLPSLALAAGVSVISAIFVSQAGCQPQGGQANPVEVGTVRWQRDYEAALASAKKAGKPVFLLFQEVPGCAGCKQFGRNVLSDTAVVESIEENFIPLLIHNNRPGKDAEVLEKFGEPAWNYQVVRFLDANGRDLIPRKDRVWDSPELKQRMTEALEKNSPGLKRAAFAQHCFWTGEMVLGGIDGVARTEAGFLDGHEVTLVDYDPTQISLADLTRKAKAAGVATRVFTALDDYRKAPESDQKRQLQGTNFARMKLTPEQATKVNAFVRISPDKAKAFLAK
jgi:Thioredoxin-like